MTEPRTEAGKALAAWSEGDMRPLPEYGPWDRVTEAILAIEAEAAASRSGEGHPDEPHEFRTVCQRCGENGYLHVSLITDLEVVKVEPRAALAKTPEARR